MPNKKIVILVVEDEKILADVLDEKLTAEGFKVVKAADGGEGLEVAVKEHPDLILLDILMPKVDGLTMLKNLRKDTWGKHASIVILTNLRNPDKTIEVVDNMGHDGVSEYMLKTSWSLENLISIIKQKLEIKQ